eukprot:9467027-Pyramimonas_sp.AAC.1
MEFRSLSQVTVRGELERVLMYTGDVYTTRSCIRYNRKAHLHALDVEERLEGADGGVHEAAGGGDRHQEVVVRVVGAAAHHLQPQRLQSLPPAPQVVQLGFPDPAPTHRTTLGWLRKARYCRTNP